MKFSAVFFLAAALAAPALAAEPAAPVSVIAPAAATEPAPLGRRMRTDITNAPAVPVAAASVAATSAIKLPPLPEGVTELRFDDFFKTPVGPRGLELTDQLKALDGKRVRIVGHMVAEQVSKDEGDIGPPGDPVRNGVTTVSDRFLLAATPQFTAYAEFGLSEDLPPQVVFVTLPEKTDAPVPFKPGPLLLTGVLSVGPRPERDDRVSVVRLKLDPMPAAVAKPAAPALSLSPVQSINNQKPSAP